MSTMELILAAVAVGLVIVVLTLIRKINKMNKQHINTTMTPEEFSEFFEKLIK